MLRSFQYVVKGVHTTAARIIADTPYVRISPLVRNLVDLGLSFAHEDREITLGLTRDEREARLFPPSAEDALRWAQADPECFLDRGSACVVFLHSPLVPQGANPPAWGDWTWDGANYRYIPLILSIGPWGGGLGLGTAPSLGRWWPQDACFARRY